VRARRRLRSACLGVLQLGLHLLQLDLLRLLLLRRALPLAAQRLVAVVMPR